MVLTSEKIRHTLTSPTIYIDIKRSEIDVRSENFLFCTSGLENKAYKGTIIIDSKGTLLKIKNVEPIGEIKLWTSIKYFSVIKEVLPNLDGEVQSISLDDFKNLIIETVSRKPKAWAALDTVYEISKEINNCKTHKDIIKYFNTRLK